MIFTFCVWVIIMAFLPKGALRYDCWGSPDLQIVILVNEYNIIHQDVPTILKVLSYKAELKAKDEEVARLKEAKDMKRIVTFY